jgi:4-amino-4-deoxy-L-arabinose transferase-like glycosyltransferase
MMALGLAIAVSFPLLDPDEGRNAEVAREMAATHDFVVPALAGMPYLDKPPGLFWMTAVAIGAAGRSPWAARLPAVLAAALTVALVCGLATRLSDPDMATRVGILLLTAPLFIILGAYVIFDMLLAACVTMIWAGVALEVTRGPARTTRLAMFAAMGFGLLIKGPVMLAWAVGGSLGAAAILRSRAPLRWLGSLPGWALALFMAGSWFALACLRHPEYPHYAFLEESFERFATSGFHRQQPVWFAPAVLAGGALSWSLATPWTRRLTPAGRVAAGFVLFATVFFTLSRSKLVTYLVPAIPPLAWMAAEAWGDPARARSGAWRLAGVYLLLGAACAVLAGVARPGHEFTAGMAQTAVWFAAAFAVAGIAGVAIARRRPAQALALNAAFPAILLVLGYPQLRAYAESQSGEPLARAIRAVSPDARVCYEYCYSPGTDYFLGHTSTLVSPLGRETTSNYQVRYRGQLMARGQWTALDTIPPERTEIVVRSALDPRPGPAGMTRFYSDRRFAAWRLAAPPTGR